MESEEFVEITIPKKNLLRRWGYIDVDKITEQIITKELFQIISKEKYLTNSEKLFLFDIFTTPSEKIPTSYNGMAAYFGKSFYQIRRIIRSLKEKGYISISWDSNSRSKRIKFNESFLIKKSNEMIRKSSRADFISSYTQDKNYFVQYLGGKCIFCEYDKNTTSLELFDTEHGDVVDDVLSIGENKFDSIGAIEKLDKCILVCSNCYQEIKSSMISASEIQKALNQYAKNKNTTCKQQICYAENGQTKGAVLATRDENGQTKGAVLAPYAEKLTQNESVPILNQGEENAEENLQYKDISNILLPVIQLAIETPTNESTFTLNLKDNPYNSSNNLLPEDESEKSEKKAEENKHPVFTLSKNITEILKHNEENKSLGRLVSPAEDTTLFNVSKSIRSGLSGAAAKTKQRIAELRNSFDKESLCLVDEMLDALKLLRKSASISINIERDWTELLHKTYFGELSYGTEKFVIDRISWENSVKEYTRAIQSRRIDNQNYFKKILISKSQEKLGNSSNGFIPAKEAAVASANRNTHSREWWIENYNIDDQEPVQDIDI